MSIANWYLGAVLALAISHLTSASAAETLLVKVNLDREHVYPGEQILVTFTISAPASAFSITHDPLTLSTEATGTIEDAANQQHRLIPLRQTKFQSTQDSLDWQHIETIYAVFATAPGTIALDPVTVRATLPITAGSGQRTNPKVSATTPHKSIEIDAAPKEGPVWLAAADVTIESEWSTEDSVNPRFTVGEPITRTIKLTAASQQAAAIPPLSIPSTEHLRVYPGNARLETTKAAKGMVGTRYEVLTLLPVTAGEIKLPEIVLDWWDINSRQWEQAVLPAETVLANDSLNVNQLANIDNQKSETFYRRLAMILAALSLLLLICCAWLSRLLVKRHRSDSRQHFSAKQLTEKQAWKLLQQAVASGPPTAFRNALKIWLHSTDSALPYRDTLIQEPELNEILKVWEQAHYAPKTQSATSADNLTSTSKKQLRKILTRLRSAHREPKRGAKDRDSLMRMVYPTHHRSI